MSPSQVVYQSKDDQVTVVAAGVTLHEALAAAEYLKKGTGCNLLVENDSLLTH